MSGNSSVLLTFEKEKHQREVVTMEQRPEKSSSEKKEKKAAKEINPFVVHKILVSIVQSLNGFKQTFQLILIMVVHQKRTGNARILI